MHLIAYCNTQLYNLIRFTEDKKENWSIFLKWLDSSVTKLSEGMSSICRKGAIQYFWIFFLTYDVFYSCGFKYVSCSWFYNLSKLVILRWAHHASCFWQLFLYSLTISLIIARSVSLLSPSPFVTWTQQGLCEERKDIRLFNQIVLTFEDCYHSFYCPSFFNILIFVIIFFCR